MKLECSYVQLPKIYSYLTGNEFKVFTVIYDEWTMMKNEDGWFYRSQKLLSQDSGLPLRTLQRTLKKLIEKGVILTTFYNDGVKMATYNKANEYKINLEVIYKLCKKDVKMTTKGCQNGAPSNNPISNNNNIYKHNIPEHEVTGEKENKKEINKEKIKEKLPDQSSMDVKVSEPDNKIISFKNMMKENEMSDNGTNVMNAISEQSERQAKENESSGCDKINEMTTSMATPNNINDTDTILQDTQVTNNESLSQPQVKNILPLPTAFEEDTDPRITKTIHNIDFSMNAMYKGRYDYGQFSSQYEYFTLQCHNLNMLMGDDKYQLYKKQYITPWWNKTKEYFPDGYEKLLKKPTQWEIDKFKKFYNWMEHAQEEREVASAYQNICALLEHLNSKYGEKTLDVLTNQIIHEISDIKHRNNHVSNYIEKIQAS